MAEPEVLEAIFQNTASMTADHLKHQLAYRHIIALADNYEGWAQDQRMSPEHSAQMLGWAESIRRLADEVTPDWNPPTPATVSIIGFLGRLALNEPSPPPTPQLHDPRIPLRQDSVLASPLEMFMDWTLSVTCPVCIETRQLPVEQIVSHAKENESVASVVGRFRCQKCGGTPSSVQLQCSPNVSAKRSVNLM